MDKVTLADGITHLYVHASKEDWVSEQIRRRKNYYELEFLDKLKELFPEQKIILDIGANIGNHTKYFLEEMQASIVHAFEPVEQNCQLFRLNNPSTNLYKIALSNCSTEEKSYMFNTSQKSFGGFSLNREPSSFMTAESTTIRKLDDFEFNDVTLVKIDVENHEKEVLEGGQQTILRNRPVVVVENSYHFFSHIFPDPRPHDKIMRSFGYVLKYSNLENSGMDVWVPEKEK